MVCQKGEFAVDQLVLAAITAINKAGALTERERGEELRRCYAASHLVGQTMRQSQLSVSISSRLRRTRSRVSYLQIFVQQSTVLSRNMCPHLQLWEAHHRSCRNHVLRMQFRKWPPPRAPRTVQCSSLVLRRSTGQTPLCSSNTRSSCYDKSVSMNWRESHEPILQESSWLVLCGRHCETSDHEEQLMRLFRLSSLLFLRIDVEGLDTGVTERLLDLRRNICCGEAEASVFCHGNGCRLSPADIASIQRVASLLDVSANTRFHPREIGCAESFLVRVAATKHVRGHRLDHRIKLDQIQTSFFSQGRSRAKVVMVRLDDSAPGFVMKVDEAEQLRKEMQLYYTYISWWDGRTSPELYFHGDAAAIIFSLVDSPDTPGSPAPTLDDQIEKAVNGELGSWGEAPPREEDLTIAIERTVAKLACLNRHQCTDKGCGYRWMADTIGHLASKGVIWEITDIRGNPIALPDITSRAATIIQPLQDAAFVHGDVHLMNVLLRENRDPFLINYEYSGPGHPCFDLARLDAAVMFKCFRAVVPEPRLAAFVAAISVGGVSYANLERNYRDVLTSVGNRIAAKTSISVRKQCLDLLTERGANVDHYYAMKVLVSSSALTMLSPSPQCAEQLSQLSLRYFDEVHAEGERDGAGTFSDHPV